MYPEVERFFAALKAADDAEDAAMAAAWNAFEQAEQAAAPEGHTHSGPCARSAFRHSGPARDARCEAEDAAEAAQAAAYAAAWDELKKSPDPLVRWIAANCRVHAFEARAILRLLPASLVELDLYAEAQQWCEVYGRQRIAAMKAGVLPGQAAVHVRSEAG